MISQNFIQNNFPKGMLTLIGGRPAVGKTALAVSLAISMAELNQRVIYFSLEMSRKHLVKRIRLQNKYYIKENIVIDDTPCIEFSHIRSRLEAESVDCVFLDYIQLMEVDNKEISRESGFASIVNNLKELAKELNIPVIVLSQLNRGCDNSYDSFREFSLVDLTGVNAAYIFRDNICGLSEELPDNQIRYKSYIGSKVHTMTLFYDSESAAVYEYHANEFMSFNDLVILYALNECPVLDYTLSAAKREPIKHAFPHLDKILHDTYGLFVFQEQLMEIAQYIGGFSKKDSDKLRKSINKKDVGEIEKVKPVFIRNAVKNGYVEQQADELYQWLLERSTYLLKREFVEKRINSSLCRLY